MICPHCRLYISNPSADFCPRCEQPLSSQPGYIPDIKLPRSAYQPTTPSSRPPRDSYADYGSQPYGNQPSGGQYSRGQQYPQGYSSPSFQPDFSAPAAPEWSPPMTPAPEPPRRRSRARRIFLFRGLAAGLLLLGCILAVGGLYFIGSQFRPRTTMAAITPFPGTTPGSTILFQDPLTSNTNGWAETNGRCFFQDNAYHIANNTVCYAPAGNFSDENIIAQAKQIAGALNHPYGIVFRRRDKDNWYEFDIDGNSRWGFFKIANGEPTALVKFTSDAVIQGGLNTTNTLLVQAKGSHFVFYVNGTNVGEADDSTFNTGLSGLVAQGSIEVAYTNFQITAVS